MDVGEGSRQEIWWMAEIVSRGVQKNPWRHSHVEELPEPEGGGHPPRSSYTTGSCRSQIPSQTDTDTLPGSLSQIDYATAYPKIKKVI
jgi:hypothetical protein